MVKNRCPQTPLTQWAAVMKSQPEKWSNFEAGGIACVCVTLIQEQTDSPHAYLLMQIWQNISLSLLVLFLLPLTSPSNTTLNFLNLHSLSSPKGQQVLSLTASNQDTSLTQHSPRSCSRRRFPLWLGRWISPQGESPRCPVSPDSSHHRRCGWGSAGSCCSRCR